MLYSKPSGKISVETSIPVSHTLSCSISPFHCHFVPEEYNYDPSHEEFRSESMLLSLKECQAHQSQNPRNSLVYRTKIRTELGEKKIQKTLETRWQVFPFSCLSFYLSSSQKRAGP